MPVGGDVAPQLILCPAGLVDIVSREDWWSVRGGVEPIEEVEVPLTRQDRHEPADRGLPVTSEACLELSRGRGQEASQDVGIAHLPERSADPFEVFSDMARPDRIEHRLQGLQIGTKTSYGHPSLVDILRGQVGSGEPQPPVVMQQPFETVEDGPFEDISDR